MNSHFDIIEEKVASFIAYNIFIGEAKTLTFILQYFVTLPAFLITENLYAAHGVNLAIQSLSFLIALRFIFQGRGDTIAKIALCLFPAYYNFTIFGLRDPYINLISTILVAVLINMKGKSAILSITVLALTSIFVRPEFSVIILGFGLMKIYLNSSLTLKAISLAGYTAIFYVALLFMPLVFGVSSTGSATGNIQKIAEFNEQRHNRRLDGGGSGSHIIQGKLYTLPLSVRYPIQVAATFIAPLPFEIRGPTDILAFGESIFFSFFAFLAWYRSRGLSQSRFIFLCAMLYLLLTAVFAINYGNILRVRYPAFIFFIGAIVYARIERQTVETLAKKN